MHTFLIILAALVAAVGLISLGFAIAPRPYGAHNQPSQPGGPAPLRSDLPEPVRRHFQDTLGESAQRVETAIVWGRGKACVRSVWIPMRFKAWYRPGQSFYRRTALTWFRRTILHASERFVRGRGSSDLGGKEESGPFIDQGEVLALWAQMVWMPAFLAVDPSARWEPVDEQTARLVIETGDGTENLLAHFDPQTGRMTHLSGMRYSDEEEDGVFVKVPWRVDLLDWKAFPVGDTSILLPHHIDMASGESGSPQIYWILDGVAYNVNVADQLGE